VIKLITVTLFSSAIEVDEQGKIINTPLKFKNFLNKQFSFFEEVLKKQKYYSLKIQEVNE